MWGSEKLFNDAADWKTDWQTSFGTPPPAASAIVNRRMWDVHSYLGTTCNGNTSDVNTILGGRLFADYGVNWKWGARFGVDYALASGVNKLSQPGLLTAQSVWAPGEPPEGHGFVTHGWNDNDQHQFICLGWGSAFHDKWISFSVLSSVNAFYVAQKDLALAKEGDEPDTFDRNQR